MRVRVPSFCVFATIAIASLSSCFEKPELVGRLCSEAEPCPDGLVCRETHCMPACVSSDECPTDQEQCVEGACQPLSALCVSDDECTTPNACELPDRARCAGGVCSYRAIECLTPPPSECIEGDSAFKVYSTIGACASSNGACEYTSRIVDCPGCAENCLDSCLDVTCEEINGGCRLEGFCTPGLGDEPASCAYHDADDGTSCTLEGELGRGVCRAGSCIRCNRDADCDDGNSCTDDACITSEGTCHYTNNASACDDNDACTNGPGNCTNGECVFNSRVLCDSPPACSEGSGECDPTSGACNYPASPANAACDDDGNACTNDVCDGAGACIHSARPDGVACRDEDGCTGVEACRAGECVPSTGVSCNEPPNECYSNAGVCDAMTGQCEYMPHPVNTPCSDEGNFCTDDVCDGSGLCVHRAKNNGTSCDDGDGCTMIDTCESGACVGDAPINCNNPPGACYGSSGSCDPTTGACIYPPLASGTACSSDGNVCTADTCNGQGVCTHPNRAVGYTCDDGNLCTRSDGCNGSGACTGTSYSCADGNACTTDACDGTGGCTHTDIAPTNLSASQSNDHEIMRWNACSNAAHYDVNIEEQDSAGNWFFYFTYDENNPLAPTTNEKSVYPIRCNKWMRFRVRSYNGTTHGPWSPYFDFYFAC